MGRAKNISKTDRFIRLIQGLIFIGLMLFVERDTFLVMLYGLIGLYLIVTSIIGICAIYILLSIKTTNNGKKMY